MYRLKCLLLNLILQCSSIGKRKDIKELLMLLYDVYTCVGEGIINLWLIVSLYNYHFYGVDVSLESLEIWLTLSFIVVCLALLIVVYIPRFLRDL